MMCAAGGIAVTEVAETTKDEQKAGELRDRLGKVETGAMRSRREWGRHA